MSRFTAGDNHHRGVDPRIWRACAGASIQIPLLYSRVYYFPQGHVEHCCPSLLPFIPPSTSPVPCFISSFRLLVDPITGEVFAHLSLTPVSLAEFASTNFPRLEGDVDNDNNNNKVTTFAKILTPSDANNGGGFSVPRLCALSVFPPLDFKKDLPVQNLPFTDIHGGAVWKFRHIYRGAPKRHLLTTGWSKFVNNKKLIAGDSVVFMKTSAGELFIGVRRAPVSSYDEGDEYNQSSGGVSEEDAEKQFRRTGEGRLTASAVSEAMRKAAQGRPFEVVYYPTAGWSEFVVRAEDVDSSMSMPWTPGARVKMAIKKTDDPSQITSFHQGIVSSVDPWRASPWKPLQITWDEPEKLQNVKRVNPWQVEIVANAPQLHATFPPSPYVFSHTTVPAGMQGARHYEFGSFYPRQTSAAAPADPSPFSHTTVLAGMQGARDYESGSYNPTGFIGERPPEINIFRPRPEWGKVSTELNLGSLSSDDLSPNSNITNLSSGNYLVGNRGPMSAKAKPFVLFGNTMTMQEPSESGLAGSGLSEEDGSKKYRNNETEFDFFATKLFYR